MKERKKVKRNRRRRRERTTTRKRRRKRTVVYRRASLSVGLRFHPFSEKRSRLHSKAEEARRLLVRLLILRFCLVNMMSSIIMNAIVLFFLDQA